VSTKQEKRTEVRSPGHRIAKAAIFLYLNTRQSISTLAEEKKVKLAAPAAELAAPIPAPIGLPHRSTARSTSDAPNAASDVDRVAQGSIRKISPVRMK